MVLNDTKLLFKIYLNCLIINLYKISKKKRKNIIFIQ